jgi:5-methylcytosine-specific restriction protein A
MLQLISDYDETNKCQVRFDNKLAVVLKNREFLNIGYQGGHEIHEVYTDGDIWYANKEIDYDPSQRYWNAFGIGLFGGSNDIVVEINIPFKGVNRRVAGLYARDPYTNDVFLLHRGKVGGGRKGIGKRAFLNWYRGERVKVDEADGRISEAILVTSLEASDFLFTLKYFIHRVERFKEIIIPTLKC